MSAKIIGALVALLLVLSGIYLLFGSPVSDEEKLMRAERNMRALDSYGVDIMTSTEFVGAKEEVKFQGNVLVDNEEKAGRGDGELTILTEGVTMLFEGSLTYVDDNLYARVDTLPAAPFLPVEIRDIRGKEVLIVENLMSEVDSLLGEISEEREIEDLTVEGIMKDLEEYSMALWEEGAIKVMDVKIDDLDGEIVRKYELAVEGDVVNDATKELMETYEVYEMLENMLGLKEGEFAEEMEKELKDAYEDVELYVWSDGEHILKVKSLSTTKISSEDLEGLAKEDDLPREARTVTEIRYHSFNEDFEIEAPEEYLILEEVLRGFSSPAFGPPEREMIF